MNQTLSGHERLYRALLRAYPARFRSRFGDEMVQLFGDLLRDARSRDTPSGPTLLWIRTLWDLAVTAAGEHGRERTVAHSLSLPPSKATRILGVLGILGGAILLAAFLPSMIIGPPWNSARLALFCLGAMAIVVAVHRRQVALSPLLAWSGAIPAFVVNGTYLVMLTTSIGQPNTAAGDFTFVWFLLGFGMWMADAWFGIVTFKLGVVSRWGALALILGSMAAIGMDRFRLVTSLEPTIFTVLALSGVALNGLGWVLLGFDVVTRRQPIPLPPVQE